MKEAERKKLQNSGYGRVQWRARKAQYGKSLSLQRKELMAAIFWR
jgi:hypothetical protein